MAKAIKKVIKVQVRGGQANPAPPLGPALGQAGVDISGFVTKFNDQTKTKLMGKLVPVQITVYDDRSFTFVVKQPAMSNLIKEEAKIDAGSGEPNKKKVGKLNKAQVRKIAEAKMPDLNAGSIESAERTVMGTARSMGVTIE